MKRKVIKIADKSYVISLPIDYVRRNKIISGMEVLLVENDDFLQIFPDIAIDKRIYIFRNNYKVMKRKVIQLAGKTMVVSLPIKWVEKHQIQKGAELELSEKENSLVIFRDALSSIMKKEVVVKKGDVFTRRYVADLYKQGYDEIRITYEDGEVLQQIKKADLLGFEIVNQGKGFCVIKNVSQTLESEFDVMLRRSLILTKEMSSIILSHVRGEDANLQEIYDLEKMNNKFTDFCLRILNKYGIGDQTKTHFYYVIVREIEALADIYKYIVEDMENIKKLKKFEELHAFLELFYELFYKFSDKLAKQFHEEDMRLEKELKDMLKRDTFFVHYMMNIRLAIHNLLGPLQGIQ